MSAKPSCSASTSGLVELVEAPLHAVEHGVGGLVGDDVVRQAGVDPAARHMWSPGSSAAASK